MLVNLNYTGVQPSFIYAMISKANGIDLSDEKNYFDHIDTGIYRHDGYAFNGEGFIEECCSNTIVDKWVAYGVCDNYQQIKKEHKDLIEEPNKKYVVIMTTVEREKQPCEGGWRWHKWGAYIGNQNPQHEYIYDDEHIDKVYCYSIYEID